MKYVIQLQLIKEEEGGYSAIALNLPGAASCGDTRQEAIENAKEACQGCVECYLDDGVEIPWANNIAHNDCDIESVEVIL